MKKTVFILGLTAMILSSCGGNGKLSLLAYNERAVSLFNDFSERNVNDREIIFENTLSKEENLKLIVSMDALIDSCLNVMNALNYPDDAKAFHESLVNLYNYSKENMTPILVKIQNVEYESEEWSTLWNEYDKKTDEVSVLLEDMSKYQQELARKANATLR